VIHFCTYFDRNYLPRGLALFRSLQRHSEPFVLWVLCFDDDAYETLVALKEPSIRPIRQSDFEAGDEALAVAKANRTRVEYFFTCTPSLPLYILKQEPEIESITYVDADLLFFSDPAVCLAGEGTGSIVIIPHGFPEHLRYLESHGIFNVGLVSFRNDANGIACLQTWRAQCLEWCYDRVEDGKFADQKYLDDWPTRYSNVRVLTDPGIGLGPWNVSSHQLRASESGVLIDGHQLVFYHFHAFRQVRSWLFDLGLAGYGTMPRKGRQAIYGSYIRELRSAEQWAANSQSSSNDVRKSIRSGHVRPTGLLKRLARGQLMVSAGPLEL
jgi:hypothetical protein